MMFRRRRCFHYENEKELMERARMQCNQSLYQADAPVEKSPSRPTNEKAGEEVFFV